MTEKQSAFRFVDEHLQSLLVQAIENAGLTCQVAEDGTVLYSPTYSIEKFIDQVVRTVFPQSYYRTEISDNVKAARYRRFTQFNGTRLVEESRDGKTSFVQEIYEKLYRYGGIPTHLSFTLADESLDPGKVTTSLGLLPTFACRKGEPFARPYSRRREDAPLRPSHKGWWELCSIPDVTSNELEPHLEWLFEMIEPVSSKLQGIRAGLAGEDVVIVQIDIVKSRSGFEGVSLSSTMLTRLGGLSDRIDIRFWPDDYV